MGMDVYGKNPENETGRYFRASVWGWHPLAEYLVKVAPDLMAKVTYLHSNDRDGLGHEDSVALATALQQALTSGHTAAYVQARDEAIAALPRLTCRFCEGTGTRSDEVGVRLGFAARNWCNACDGKGDTEPWEASYSLDVGLVREFAAFVRRSGGFEIC
ncbi:hypothetical protein DEJ04_17325 [Curtobacterium sp. MCLR17_044]|nr:hypothetical protein DEJ04_17325 [Curtobacterium sp. MCLR17_044]